MYDRYEARNSAYSVLDMATVGRNPITMTDEDQQFVEQYLSVGIKLRKSSQTGDGTW